jgi:hypothetical protein
MEMDNPADTNDISFRIRGDILYGGFIDSII